MSRPKPDETPEQYAARQAMYVQRWRMANPEKQALARKRAYSNRKRKAFDLVGGAKCVRCGCDELDFLEFNHIGGNGCAEWRESNGTAMMDRILTFKRATDDLEVLCRICNALDYLERKNPEAAKGYSIEYRKRYAKHIGSEDWEAVTPAVEAVAV